MSEEYFEKVLDEISDERIQNAVSYSKKKRIFPFKLAAAVAASLVIVAAGTFSVLNTNLFGKEDTTNPPAVCATSANSYTEYDEVGWKKIPENERYENITLKDGKIYSSMYTEKSDGEKGEFVFLEIAEAEGENGNVTDKKTVEVYSVKNFSSDLVVAAKFEESEKYFLYLKNFYSPKTLGDFLSDADFENSVTCRGVSFVREKNYTYKFSSKEEKEKRDEAFSAFLGLLKSEKERRTELSVTDSDGKMFDFAFHIDGFDSFLATVYSTGDVEFRSDCTANTLVFNFDEGKVKALFEILEKNSVKTDVCEETTTSPKENSDAKAVLTTAGYSETKVPTSPPKSESF